MSTTPMVVVLKFVVGSVVAAVCVDPLVIIVEFVVDVRAAIPSTHRRRRGGGCTRPGPEDSGRLSGAAATAATDTSAEHVPFAGASSPLQLRLEAHTEAWAGIGHRHGRCCR